VEDVVIVVAGHDKYSAAWPAMMHGIEKYLSLAWPIYWMTNHLDAPKECITVKMGGDFNPKRWSNRVKGGLKQIPAKTILWMLDDHWITQTPDSAALIDFALYIKRGLAHRIRLYPGWDHDRSSGAFEYDKRLLIMGKKSPYRTSCKPSFWNRGVFLSLLKANESPWDFEQYGRKRSGQYTFMAVKDWGHFPFVTKGDPTGPWAKSPLVKGKWTMAAAEYCKREGLDIDLKKHPMKGNPFGKEKPKYILP
jgi:hypothetical protein